MDFDLKPRRKKRSLEISSNIEDFDHPNNMYTLDVEQNIDMVPLRDNELYKTATRDTHKETTTDKPSTEGKEKGKEKYDKHKKKKKKREKEKHRTFKEKMRNEVLNFYDDDFYPEDESLDLDYDQDDLSQVEADQFRYISIFF